MKKLFLFMTLCALVSCAPNPNDSAIKTTLAERYSDAPLGYQLLRYEIVDTLYYGDMLGNIAPVDKTAFTKQRNQEFTQFRMNGREYERDIMRGELKDASEWCTELRLITERADKVLANFDSVKLYDYEYQYLSAWYNSRFWNFCGNTKQEHRCEEWRKFIQDHAHIFNNTDNISDDVKQTPLNYIIRHDYSIMIGGKRVEDSEELVLNEIFELAQ